jgi:serine/threonine protein kinase
VKVLKKRINSIEKEFIYSELYRSGDLKLPIFLRIFSNRKDELSKRIIISELCRHGSLEHIAETDRNLAFLVITKSFGLLLSTLKELHRLDYIHGDIKPGNILVRSDYTAVLADFGALRKITEERPILGDECGTPFYNPPELFSATTTPTDLTKRDVWALGIALLELMGGFPFDRIKYSRYDSLKIYMRNILEHPEVWEKHIREKMARVNCDEPTTLLILGMCKTGFSERTTIQQLIDQNHFGTGENINKDSATGVLAVTQTLSVIVKNKLLSNDETEKKKRVVWQRIGTRFIGKKIQRKKENKEIKNNEKEDGAYTEDEGSGLMNMFMKDSNSILRKFKKSAADDSSAIVSVQSTVVLPRDKKIEKEKIEKKRRVKKKKKKKKVIQQQLEIDIEKKIQEKIEKDGDEGEKEKKMEKIRKKKKKKKKIVETEEIKEKEEKVSVDPLELPELLNIFPGKVEESLVAILASSMAMDRLLPNEEIKIVGEKKIRGKKKKNKKKKIGRTEEGIKEKETEDKFSVNYREPKPTNRYSNHISEKSEEHPEHLGSVMVRRPKRNRKNPEKHPLAIPLETEAISSLKKHEDASRDIGSALTPEQTKAPVTDGGPT